MKRTIAVVIAAVAALPVLLALLLFFVRICAFDLPFYVGEYDKYGNAQTIGVSEDDLLSITENLINYMKGTRADLNMQFPVNGESREIFSEREKEHMVDVLGLINLSGVVMYGAAGAGVVLIALSVLIAPRDRRLRTLGVGYLIGTGAFALLSGALVLIISLNYTEAFIQFHMLFFTNDKWLLDETEHILIMMMPLGFFEDISRQIALFYGLGVLVSLLLAVACILPGRRTRGVKEEIFAGMPDGGRVKDALPGAADTMQDGMPHVGRSGEGAPNAPWPSEPAIGFAPTPQQMRYAPTGQGGGEQWGTPVEQQGTGAGEAPIEGEGMYRMQPPPQQPTSTENIFNSFGLSDKDDQPLMPDERGQAAPSQAWNHQQSAPYEQPQPAQPTMNAQWNQNAPWGAPAEQPQQAWQPPREQPTVDAPQREASAAAWTPQPEATQVQPQWGMPAQPSQAQAPQWGAPQASPPQPAWQGESAQPWNAAAQSQQSQPAQPREQQTAQPWNAPQVPQQPMQQAQSSQPWGIPAQAPQGQGAASQPPQVAQPWAVQTPSVAPQTPVRQQESSQPWGAPTQAPQGQGAAVQPPQGVQPWDAPTQMPWGQPAQTPNQPVQAQGQSVNTPSQPPQSQGQPAQVPGQPNQTQQPWGAPEPVWEQPATNAQYQAQSTPAQPAQQPPQSQQPWSQAPAQPWEQPQSPGQPPSPSGAQSFGGQPAQPNAWSPPPSSNAAPANGSPSVPPPPGGESIEDMIKRLNSLTGNTPDRR